eukprot:15693272-Heterocapsa_arctica.AAC.1
MQAQFAHRRTLFMLPGLYAPAWPSLLLQPATCFGCVRRAALAQAIRTRKSAVPPAGIRPGRAGSGTPGEPG